MYTPSEKNQFGSSRKPGSKFLATLWKLPMRSQETIIDADRCLKIRVCSETRRFIRFAKDLCFIGNINLDSTHVFELATKTLPVVIQLRDIEAINGTLS